MLEELGRFTGPGAEQEDDITMVTLQRAPGAAHAANGTLPVGVLAEFELPSRPGNERLAIDRVRAAVAALGLGGDRVERLGTAVGEATMNAMEHGNGYRDDRPVTIRVVAEPDRLRVEITDLGGARARPAPRSPTSRRSSRACQRPRGWGLFLIEHMVDETRETGDDRHHTVELSLRLGGEGDDHT